MAGLASGCSYEPLPCLLGLEEGELVLTEIRGAQDGTRGEWLELYNASGAAIDLRGLRGTMQPIEGSEVDGEAAVTFLVRTSVPVPADAYVVLGLLPLDEVRRPELDYSINGDLQRGAEQVTLADGVVVEVTSELGSDPRTLFPSAVVRLYACERELDRFVYLALPELGTLSFDGAAAPDADDNDDLSRWCTDATPPPTDGPQTATGHPGSGGEANRPCP